MTNKVKGDIKGVDFIDKVNHDEKSDQ